MACTINPGVFNDKETLKEGLRRACCIIHSALLPVVAKELYTEPMGANR